MKKKKIIVAVPCMDKIDTQFVMCLLNLQSEDLISHQFHVGSLVYAAREELTKTAIKQKADYVLWLDSDMTFNPDLLVRLLKHNKDVVSAMCFKRRPPYDPPFWSKIRLGLTPDENIVEEINVPWPEKLFEVDACGTAGLLVKTKVLKDVLEKKGTCFSPLPGFGEDLSFCIRAKQLGYSIWCDPTVLMGHITQSVITQDSFFTFKQHAAESDFFKKIMEDDNGADNT